MSKEEIELSGLTQEAYLQLLFDHPDFSYAIQNADIVIVPNELYNLIGNEKVDDGQLKILSKKYNLTSDYSSEILDVEISTDDESEPVYKIVSHEKKLPFRNNSNPYAYIVTWAGTNPDVDVYEAMKNILPEILSEGYSIANIEQLEFFNRDTVEPSYSIDLAVFNGFIIGYDSDNKEVVEWVSELVELSDAEGFKKQEETWKQTIKELYD